MIPAIQALAFAAFLQVGAGQPAPVVPATVRGTITDAATGKPVRMVRVFLTPEGRVPGATQRSTRTDERGAFELPEVVPGRYKLTASKARYATTELGQTHVAGAGRALTIAAGDRLERVDVALLRAAAITGRVVDDLGEPLQGRDRDCFQVRIQRPGSSSRAGQPGHNQRPRRVPARPAPAG